MKPRTIAHRLHLSQALMGRETKPAIQRFMDKIKIIENGCWEWQGAIKPGGYGVFCITRFGQRKAYNAHRWLFIQIHGAIEEGMTLDHLCRNRKYVNPNHLELVTMRENLLRGNGLPAINAHKTYCSNGHPLIPIIHKNKSRALRHCPICEKEKAYSWRAKNPERYLEIKAKSHAKRKMESKKSEITNEIRPYL